METELPVLPDYIKELIESDTGIDEIFLNKEGLWFHNGEKFTNEKIISFFSRSVNVTAEGQYVLQYGNHVYPIKVEDAPYFITGVTFSGFGDFEKVTLNLSSGETEELNCRTLYCRKNNALYCRIKNGSMPAKFRRSPSFNIMERLEEASDGKFYLRLCGQIIELTVRDE
jgi:hypothetical protein